MINAKKSLFMLAACTVLAVTVSASTFSAPRVMSAQEEVRQEPLQIAQTETSGVSLAVERVAAAASEIGREEVTATVSPSNALYDLEWSLTVGDSLIPEADMSDYLTIEEKSATTIELVCHQRFDGYAKLHVEDAYTGKTATADVSAWTFSDGRESLAQNGDFSDTLTTKSWTFQKESGTLFPTVATEQIAENWSFTTNINTLSSGSVNLAVKGGRLGVSTVSEGVQMTYNAPSGGYGALTQSISTDTLVPGKEYNLVIEEESPNDTVKFYGNGNFVTDDYHTLLGSWTMEGKTIFHFRVEETTITNTFGITVFGFGYTFSSSLLGGSIGIKSVELYAA